MIEIQDYIRKLYEQTGVKLKDDDPILIELVAQQIILEEFTNDIENVIEKIQSDHQRSIELIKNKNNSAFNKSLKEIKECLQKQKVQIQKNIGAIKRKNELFFYILIAINYIFNIVIIYQILK